MRKERRCMAVASDAQHHQVEARNPATEVLAQRVFVLECRIAGTRARGRHGVDVFARAGHVVQQSAPRHSVVAACVAVWYVALVAPENMDVSPRHLFSELCCEQPVEWHRRAAARKGKGAAAVHGDGLVNDADGGSGGAGVRGHGRVRVSRNIVAKRSGGTTNGCAPAAPLLLGYYSVGGGTTIESTTVESTAAESITASGAGAAAGAAVVSMTGASSCAVQAATAMSAIATAMRFISSPGV